jgi:hypothetical protein
MESKYEGDWENDEMHGLGKYYNQINEKKYYEGFWKNNQFEGEITKLLQ